MNAARLRSVLRIRQMQERSARGELAARRGDHRLAQDAEHVTWRLLDDRVSRRCTGSSSTSAFLADRAMVAAGMFAAETQHEVTVVAAASVQTAAEQWTTAARRVEGLERLAERTDLADREESARKSANEIDDLVIGRFVGRGA